MVQPVKVMPNYASGFSDRLRSHLSIVPAPEKNSAVQLPSDDDEKHLTQTLRELRTYGEEHRRTAEKDAPICFISFVHSEQHDPLVEKIAKLLEIAGITVYVDHGDRHEQMKLGRATYLQKAMLEKWDSVIVIGTPDYLKVYEQAADKKNPLIQLYKKLMAAVERFAKANDGLYVIPLLTAGNPADSFPAYVRENPRSIRHLNMSDFSNELLKMVRETYRIAPQDKKWKEIEKRRFEPTDQQFQRDIQSAPLPRPRLLGPGFS